jgi:hypothetical protein
MSKNSLTVFYTVVSVVFLLLAAFTISFFSCFVHEKANACPEMTSRGMQTPYRPLKVISRP